jgi:hypothetical protein
MFSFKLFGSSFPQMEAVNPDVVGSHGNMRKVIVGLTTPTKTEVKEATLWRRQLSAGFAFIPHLQSLESSVELGEGLIPHQGMELR